MSEALPNEKSQMDQDTITYNAEIDQASDQQTIGAKSLVDMQKIGVDPFKEHKRVKKNIKFPMNPAFFKTSMQDRKTL